MKFIKYIVFLLGIIEKNFHHSYKKSLYEDPCTFVLFIRKSNDKSENVKILHINYYFIFNIATKITSLCDIRMIMIVISKRKHKISNLALSKQIPHIPCQV